MFTILVTATVLPIILTLSYAERKSRLMAYEKGEASVKLSLKEKFQAVFRQLDIIGLGLLGAAVALIVLPLTLSQTVKHGWKDGMSFFPETVFPSLTDGRIIRRNDRNDRHWLYHPYYFRDMECEICFPSCYSISISTEHRCTWRRWDRILLLRRYLVSPIQTATDETTVDLLSPVCLLIHVRPGR